MATTISHNTTPIIMEATLISLVAPNAYRLKKLWGSLYLERYESDFRPQPWGCYHCSRHNPVVLGANIKNPIDP
jgi:hypothetical protein